MNKFLRLSLFSTILFYTNVSLSATHFVFLLHGIGGDETTFGSMEPALDNVLYHKEPNYSHKIVRLQYATGNHDLDVFDFAMDVGQKMKQVASTLSEGDKISVIAHSQGGLVATIWFFQSMEGNPDYTPEIAPYVKNFISLGTPFGGARSAYLGMLKLPQKIISDNNLPFGKKELKEMAFGSLTNYYFRQDSIRVHKSKLFEKIKQQVRVLNVGGVIADYPILKKLMFSPSDFIYEADLAVAFPSSHLNFFYIQQRDDDSAPYSEIGFHDFKEVNFSNVRSVNAGHLAYESTEDLLKGVAYISQDCIKNPNCDHPTFEIVWKYLIGENAKYSHKHSHQHTSFAVDFNIQLPKSATINPKDIKISATRSLRQKQQEDHRLSKPNWTFGSPWRFLTEGLTNYDREQNQARFFYFGSAQNLYQGAYGENIRPDYKSFSIPITISAPGFKTRRMNIRVRPTFTTYVDVNLVPGKSDIWDNTADTIEITGP